MPGSSHGVLLTSYQKEILQSGMLGMRKSLRRMSVADAAFFPNLDIDCRFDLKIA